MDSESPRLLASFAAPASFEAALAALKDTRISVAETYTPMPAESREAASPGALVALLAGLAGGAGAFAMQAYANIWAYPLDIGGRPKFSLPSFVPIAFEIGVLFAVIGIIVSVFIFGRLLRFHAPIDDCRLMRRSLSDRWIISIEAMDAREIREAAVLCQSLGAEEIEEVPHAASYPSPVDAAAARL
ncbi:MAG: DUF3341 domain-containing protein [Methylocystis sp.]|uniref:DUF3341 domain-containing protein n=1 Tax=Methylocystis sp. TaxID=1911079 RepID=UPI003DA22398